MPNVAAVLKEEITRLARKEAKQQVGPLKKVIAEQRRTIADLRRRLDSVERAQGFLQKQEKRRLEAPPAVPAARGAAPAAAAAGDAPRFSPKWVAADRKRLGFSAKDYAKLVGVSMLTVYNWEKGKSKPRAQQLQAWANVRGIGKREALRRLELLDA